MKKQFLSLIAAGLMLGNMPQISASPVLFFGALAAAAGASHYRGAQIQQEQNKQALLAQVAENYKNLSAAQCSNGSFVQVIPDINTKSWRVIYIPCESLRDPSKFKTLKAGVTKAGVTLDFDKLTLECRPMEEPQSNETYAQYVSRAKLERDVVPLKNPYALIVHFRVESGKDPVTGK